MPPSMSRDEIALRDDLDRNIQKIRSALSACPPIEALLPQHRPRIRCALDGAHAGLMAAQRNINTMADLGVATEEALQLVPTTRMALQVVRDVITLLTAELDRQE